MSVKQGAQGKRPAKPINEPTTEILNIRVPDDLILELDNLVERRVFKSRSEAIREFAREYVQEHENAKVSEREAGRW